MSAPWKNDGGTPNPTPHVSRGVRTWFYRSLIARFVSHAERHCRDDAFALAAWYMARIESYIAWVPTASYRGTRFTAGEWTILTARVEQHRWNALADIGKQRAALALEQARANDAARFPTLDAWLDAERTGQLTYGGTAEKGAAELLRGHGAAEFMKAAAARRAKWPRACTGCRETFTPSHYKQTRCASCRPSGTRAKGSISANGNNASSTPLESDRERGQREGRAVVEMPRAGAETHSQQASAGYGMPADLVQQPGESYDAYLQRCYQAGRTHNAEAQALLAEVQRLHSALATLTAVLPSPKAP